MLLAVGGVVLWRRTQPIAEVAAIAATIGPRTLDLRLPEDELASEIAPIVQAVNGALDRLQQAAETQREFLRRAAHQLRTPLTVLSARAGTLADSETAAELRGDVQELARIVSQLLQLNEIDALPDCGARLADLGAVAEAVRDELAARPADNGSRIRLVQPASRVLVQGDPNVIEIAVRNLVENALLYSPPGSAVVVRVGTDARLEVIDAGRGIQAALRAQIFEPFWSGDGPGQRPGLGLTIVRRAIEHCGASVAVADAPGGGALFVLAFRPPASSPNAQAARATLPASHACRRRVAAFYRAAD